MTGKPPKTTLFAQSGITNRPPEHVLLTALNLVGDPRAALDALRGLAQHELSSQVNGPDGPGLADTGELGYEPHHDRQFLTITLGLSSSAYDKLGFAPDADDRPQDLIPIPWGQLEPSAPVNPDSGDVLLQICADSAYVCEHVLRRIEHELSQQVQVVWGHTGAQRYSSRAGRTARHEGRAWIGFLDGTSNLNPRHDPADRALTFVDPTPEVVAGYPAPELTAGQPSPYGGPAGPVFPPDLRKPPGHEPESCRNGTYMAVRVSAHDLKSWDALPTAEQEQMVGRRKKTGVALDLPDTETDPNATPAFAADPNLTAVAVNAHIRKANPRTPADAPRRIFRRGYPLYEGGDNGLRRGLIFICFGRTLSTQFEFITRAWLRNENFPQSQAKSDPLLGFDAPVLAGGYYFVPPLEHASQPWSWHIPAPGGAA